MTNLETLKSLGDGAVKYKDKMSKDGVMEDKESMAEEKPGLSSIPRSEFVNVIFDLGEEYDHALSTIVSAVMLGDRYIKGTSTGNDYTYELAHAALLVSVKACEDDGYRHTAIALAYTTSRTVIDLEWELLPLFCYHNFITLYHRITNEIISNERCYTICAHPEFGTWSPIVITVGLLCLRRLRHVSKL